MLVINFLKKFNEHRTSFYNPLALKAWGVGSEATLPLAPHGAKRVRCKVVRLDNEAGLCDVDFGGGRTRENVPTAELRAPKAK